MINDPIIECICDECGTEEEVRPEYKYRDYSGNNGYYDCEEEAIVEKLSGWELIDDQLLCDDCIAQKDK